MNNIKKAATVSILLYLLLGTIVAFGYLIYIFSSAEEGIAGAVAIIATVRFYIPFALGCFAVCFALKGTDNRNLPKTFNTVTVAIQLLTSLYVVLIIPLYLFCSDHLFFRISQNSIGIALIISVAVGLIRLICIGICKLKKSSNAD